MFKSDSSFVKHLNSVSIEDITTMNFKSSSAFTNIVDNVSEIQGQQYMNLIEEEFPEITHNNFRVFVNINDKYGNANKSIYEKDKKLLYTNPSNMRYIYLALLILTNLKLCGNVDVVEIGSGYGGLFLAINHFSRIMNISVKNYILIDLPEMNIITRKNLDAHRNVISIPYMIMTANDSSNQIPKNNLYLISNYCFTEIDSVLRNNYVSYIIPKVSHGFMVWQTCMNNEVRNDNIATVLNKPITKVENERPQTGPSHAINYFVYI